ncbi:type III polyketide synthase [Heliorestis convoluta]|uniref:Chalcone synthase n=1 Tax=Heliorestis convoluta TaxID=356322 RepID=A0A5Q2N7C3_9FIRM|nr:3-oxoacyl-[acyl-carrier-protein] synthase III C-terminal domain-containing protein [Heliorestis convoluta]QGG49312.1 Chalcone synthase [Heliorestis convoluta]
MTHILAVGTAVPEQVVRQSEARLFAQEFFKEEFKDMHRLLQVFERSKIEKRHFCMPSSWFEKKVSFSEKNKLYQEQGLTLGTKAVEKCLQKAGLSAQDIDGIVFVSSTGIATPSLDMYFANLLGLKAEVRRMPLWGLGCCGGAVGLSRAAELAKATPGKNILLLTLELCGLTFMHSDRSKSNLIATALFADGAAAALLSQESNDTKESRTIVQAGPTILDWQSHYWPESLDVMGWDLTDDGLQVVFSRHIPSLVKKEIKNIVEPFISRHKLTFDQIDFLIAHPGGLKVLDAYEEALGLEYEKTELSREILCQYGNMSSATVLFVLEETMKREPKKGSYGLLTALGPGFCSELLLVQW